MSPLMILGPVIRGITSIIDQTIEDKDAATRLKGKLSEATLSGEIIGMQEAASIVRAEAQGESWLQRNWRPLLMVLFGVIIANNYLLVPLFGVPSAHIPPDMWDLLKLGVGGYVLGRSGEKALRVWQERH